jgi:hypothetical protein
MAPGSACGEGAALARRLFFLDFSYRYDCRRHEVPPTTFTLLHTHSHPVPSFRAAPAGALDLGFHYHHHSLFVLELRIRRDRILHWITQRLLLPFSQMVFAFDFFTFAVLPVCCTD